MGKKSRLKKQRRENQFEDLFSWKVTEVASFASQSGTSLAPRKPAPVAAFVPGTVMKLRIQAPGVLARTGLCKILSVQYGLVSYQVGDMHAVTALDFIEIIEPEVAEPANWLGEEIDLIQSQLRTCDCDECRRLLDKKREQLRQYRQQQESDAGATLTAVDAV